MPELPDVETFRTYLQATSLRQKIRKVDLYCPRVLKDISERKFKSALKSKRLEAARRHGKYLFALLDDGMWLVLHFGMTGFLRYFKNAEKRPSHVCLLLSFVNGYFLAYDNQRKLGRISLVRDMEDHVKTLGLGPDAMAPDLSFADFQERIGKGGAMIKSALMDQERLAGIGNIYADEILFQAGVHPKTQAGRLDEKRLQTIFQTRKEVLATAIDGKADPHDLPRSYIIPRRRAGSACPKCKGAVETVKVSGRTTYYCPHCQR